MKEESPIQLLDRVNMVYETNIAGEVEKVELPFRILVLADFTRNEKSEYLGDAEPELISQNSLNGLFKALSPEIHLRVKDRLSDADDQLLLHYKFTSIDDFTPQNIINNTPAFKDITDFITLLDNLLENQKLDLSVIEPEKRAVVAAVLQAENISVEDIETDNSNISWLISNLQRRISSQIDEIIHDESFKALESAWRSLAYLVSQVDFSENCSVSVLNVSKQAVIDDFEDSPEIYRSNLYQIVYSAEYGQLGGKPYGALISDYYFTPKLPDIRLLQKIAGICAMSHAPFIAAAAPEFFSIDQYSMFSKLRDLPSIFEQPAYEKWKNFRESSDARYIGLTLPSFLLRQSYDTEIGNIEYREKIKKPENDLLWGNASFAFASRLVDSFAKYRWCLNITGKQEGRVTGLITQNKEAKQSSSAKIATQFILTDKREAEVVTQGFIPLSVHKGDDTAAFYSAYSVHDPKVSHAQGQTEDDLSRRLGAQLPYLLIISRISQYLKIMQREHIGSWKNRRDIDHELNNWLRQYVSDMDNPAPGVRARRPLRNAVIKVREVEGKGDWFMTKIQVTPHVKYMGATFALSETSKLDKT